ncbi:MAG: hypothetical protein II552_02300 [Bacteroidales bacterium]|nr:hypothetical protein [Bacteroidales bacterium]
MNIIVRTYGGKTVVRPDTTLEKQDRDLYVPEPVGAMYFSPVMFARVSGSSKDISRKFVKRYYDAVSFGILLYPRNLMDGSPEGFAAASCMDHTSFLPFPMFAAATLDGANEFELDKAGAAREHLFRFRPDGPELVENAICEATRYVFLRTGDLVAVELAPVSPLMDKEDGPVGIIGEWCGKGIMDFKIIM